MKAGAGAIMDVAAGYPVETTAGTEVDEPVAGIAETLPPAGMVVAATAGAVTYTGGSVIGAGAAIGAAMLIGAGAAMGALYVGMGCAVSGAAYVIEAGAAYVIGEAIAIGSAAGAA